MAITTNCCQLVSGLQLSLNGCIISINMNSSTEIIKECEDGTVLLGPTKGTMSINAFVQLYTTIFSDCATSANLSIPWMTRYECEDGIDTIYYINTGQGSASTIGSPPYATLLKQVAGPYPNLSASSSSGPSSVYALQEQKDGYGLSYAGGPIDFNSSIVGDLTMNMNEIIPSSTLITLGLSAEGVTMYLQSFNVNYSPGEIPTVNYSYAFSLS